jgi:hypothetical protein
MGTNPTNGLNGKTFVLDLVTSATARLINMDTGAAFDGTGLVYTSGGTLTPDTYHKACEITTWNRQGAAAASIPVSTMCSTAVEKRPGLRDNGSMTITGNWVGDDLATLAFEAMQDDAQVRNFKFVGPASLGAPVVLYQVIASSDNEAAGVNQVLTQGWTLEVTGKRIKLLGA